MDSTQRKIIWVAVSAAVVFVLASLAIAHPPEAGIRWTLCGVGLVEGKGHMFLVIRDHMQLEVSRLVAAGMVSFVWIVLVALLASVVIYLRRTATRA